MQRDPTDNLLLAVLAQMVFDFTAVHTNNQRRINDIRKYGAYSLTLKRTHSKAARVKQQVRFKNWLESQKEILWDDVTEWGAPLAEYLGISTAKAFVEKMQQIRDTGAIIEIGEHIDDEPED